MCSWSGVGEVLGVRLGGKWADAEAENGGETTPRYHLIRTSSTDKHTAHRIEATFARVLIDADKNLLSWIGANDDLDDWLGTIDE